MAGGHYFPREELPELVTWLNAQPAAQRVLRREFAGTPVSKQNLSEWRQGGFAEWQAHQDLLAQAAELGASGINVAGICCTANEVLRRRGVPIAGNFLQQELAIVSGAVEALLVDVQCVMPGIVQAAGSGWLAV